MKLNLVHEITLVGFVVFTGCTTSNIDTSPKRVSEIVEVSSKKFRADFEAASLDIVLDSYGNTCGRTMLLAPGIPDTTITLKSDALTNREFLYAVEESLRSHGIDLIADGDKFVRVVPIKNK